MKYLPRVLFTLSITLLTVAVTALLPGDIIAADVNRSLVSQHISYRGPATLGSSYQVLHSFSGSDGGGPNALIQASDGSLYGSAANGGDTATCSPDGCGTLFKLDGGGKTTVLHTFHASDGYSPTGLIQARDGTFYGTTTSGGQPSGGGAGTLFRMDAAGNVTVLHAFVGGFACCDGAGPSGPPTQGRDGALYGVTGAGGAFRDLDHQGGFGTIYRYDPGTGVLTILHSFNLADGNGIFPNESLVQGTDGLFYGTTREGGGGVFRIDATGNFALVHRITDSGEPLAGLIQATDGFLYGTTDGPPGTVFRVDPAGNYAVVNRFDGGDGYGLNHALMQANDGLFYGTAPEGGLFDFQAGDVFRLDANGTLSVLHSFAQVDASGGIIPNSRLIQAMNGLVYGTTGVGGTGGHGTIFQLDPRVPGPVTAVTVKPRTVTAGKSATGTVMLSRPAPAGGTVIALRASSFQVTLPETVTVRAGTTTASFIVKTAAIGSNASVRIYASIGGAGIRAILTILPPLSLPHLASLTLSPARLKGSNTATGTVTLTGPALSGGAIVTLASSSAKAVVPASVKIPAGATRATFVVQTRAVKVTRTVSITASYNGDTLRATLTILH